MSQTEEIKERLDIAELIGEYITLKSAGSGSFKAVCPFHREKSPSFYVSTEKQIWHCFGCDVGGDHFAFLMQLEGIDFPEALRQLAEKAGVVIQRYATEEANTKTRLYKILDLAVRFYHKYLLEAPSAQIARDYLLRRAVPSDLIENFQLGYAPDRWDALVGFLKKRGFHDQEIIDAGLAIRRHDGTGVYDRFRHRVMFPITDVRGRMVGFSGRLLDETRDEGKYINTPQTAIYNKSQVLYGLHLAKAAIKKAAAAVIVEGNMDVIASHKADVLGVVASSGTALTREQINLLRRFTDTLLVCFDADAAGEHAAKRGIDLALEEGMNVKVIRLVGAKDPDELVKQDLSKWQASVQSATDIMTYYFDKAFANGDPKTAADKKQAGKTLLPEIARLPDPIERTHWMKQLSERLDVPESVLWQTAERYRTPSDGRNAKANASPAVTTPVRVDRRTKLMEQLLGMLFGHPEMHHEVANRIQSEDLTDPHRSLYLSFVSRYHEHDVHKEATDIPKNNFFIYFRQKMADDNPDIIPLLDRLVLEGEQLFASQALPALKDELELIAQALHKIAQHEVRSILAHELRNAERTGDNSKIEELSKKYSELT